MKQIITLVKDCQNCPESYEEWDYEKREYTGILKCDLLDAQAVDYASIPDNCPLEDAE